MTPNHPGLHPVVSVPTVTLFRGPKVDGPEKIIVNADPDTVNRYVADGWLTELPKPKAEKTEKTETK